MIKNILVTGGLGLLGKPLVTFLKKKKYNVFVLDRSKNKKKNRLVKGRNIYFIYGNYQNKNFLKKTIKNRKINIIFHTGAVTQVLEGLKYPLKTYKNNIMGTINILECIRQINPKILLIYSSSDKAYGEIKKRNYLESDNLNSIYPYDLSKTCSDLICQSYSKVYNLKVAIVRCGNLFGPGDFNKNRIIPETILSTLKNQSLRVRSSGKLIRDYLYVDDAVKAYFMIMNKLKNSNSKILIYNVGSKDNLSVIKLVNMILSLMKRKDLKPIILNKSKKELKWRQRITIKKGLNKTINWYKENRNLY